MPNWKKLIVSGSSANLSNLTVDNAVTASFFKGDGSALTGVTTQITETATVADTFTSVTSKVVTHSFGTKNVLVTVYNDSDQQIIPSSITTTDNDTVTVTFDSATTGRIVVAKGGHIVQGVGTAANSNTLNGQSGSYYLNFNNHTNNPFTASAGQITGSGHFVPSQTETYDLGSANLRWRDLYLSGSTINLGGTLITRDSNGNIEFKESGTNTRKTLKVDELEIQRGDKSVRLKLDSNNKVRFEDTDTGDTLAPTYFKQSITGASSYFITHSLDEYFPIVQVYTPSREQVIPKNILSTTTNITKLEFDSSFTGTVVVKK